MNREPTEPNSARRSRGVFLLLGPVLLALGLAGPLSAQSPATSTSACITCHSDASQVGDDGVRIVQLFQGDVHQEAGLSCQDCHGGNHDLSVADDMVSSMDEDFRANPFRGAPERMQIPQMCGHCHSDATFMKQYKPDIRVDQEEEYYTSQHGLALRQGDKNVATCVDCHGSHGILHPTDPRAPVYPTNVAETCRTCHSDADRMKGYLDPHGNPLPVDQYQQWVRSVHGQAMKEKGDISAPTCNDCHGNHGAAPPGLESVAFVCGQCHGREANLFRQSSKHELWQAHNEFLADAGKEGCQACHDASEQPGQVTDIHSFSECATCHSNHGIVRPTVALFSPLPDVPCAFCHEGEGPLSDLFPEDQQTRGHYQEIRDTLLEEASEKGLERIERFDWMVDQALQLPFHRTETENPEEASLRPEFQNLFTKFRIGKTYFEYTGANGETVRRPIVRCNHCHSQGDSSGSVSGSVFLNKMMQLTGLTARAERVLLKARRGGIETREALLEVDQALNAQISLEAQIHSFDPTGDFEKSHETGLEHASAALKAGQEARQELSSRRTGLYVSLVFILLVLIGLGMKIRQLR